jgi:hypothetical protein
MTLQARLADFWIPQRGLFAVGRAFLEPLDAARHVIRFVTAGHEAAVPVER